MKAEVYWIKGCRGAQVWHSNGVESSMKVAKQVARDLNQGVADRLGQSFRQYKSENEGREGWFSAGKSGLHGTKV